MNDCLLDCAYAVLMGLALLAFAIVTLLPAILIYEVLR